MADQATATRPAAPTTADVVTELAKWLQQQDRADLAQRASISASRLRRPSTIVCVVGEFKQGKSSLVNALLGRDLCPVDDDLATSAITMVRYGEAERAVVKVKRDDAVVDQEIAVGDVKDWVSEVGNPGNAKQVERLDLVSTSAVLKQGLVLVDTPGMGGLGAGHAAATLGFLPFADGLIFVSDASAELSAPEIAFLRRARDLCPTVLFALTKIDLYPSWERILELDRGHLDRAGLSIPIVPISSTLRSHALERKDRELNARSRLPDLVAHLSSDVVGPAKATAAARTGTEASGLIGQVRSGLEAERSILVDPESAAAALAELDAAKQRLEHLRGPSAKWTQLVGDRVGDLSGTVNYKFRAAARTIQKQMDERIEQLTKGNEWDELSRHVQTVVAEQVTMAFVDLEKGRHDVRAEVVDLIRDENLELAPEASFNSALDVRELWQAKSLDANVEKAGKRVFNTAVTTIRGAQGGIYMFGMLGSFLPAAAGVLMASNPVLLGVGAVFGSMGLMDDRKRKVQTRRQAARTQVRQFLDDVQFEMGNQITNLVKEIQRDLRDEFTGRLTDLQRTYTETVTRAQADAQRSTAERQTRLKQVDSMLSDLGKYENALRNTLAAEVAP
jgi:GTPase SAR1 family protein